MFVVDVGGKTQIRGKKVVHVVEVEDTISTLWEEIKSQPEELEDKYFFEEFEDNIDTLQPTSKESKLYQSSFKFKDMALPYGGGERCVRQFSGAAGTIEVDDLKKEFTIWCELQKSRNPNFNSYMV
jgi:hypothetical protein